MPNHVTNIVRAKSEVLRGFIREPTAEEISERTKGKPLQAEFIDFGTVIPIPADDDPRVTASKTDYGNGMVGWSFDGLSPMDFARTMWGTKWNAYEQELNLEDGYVKFETAWSHPTPVIVALSLKFPDEPIIIRYADEDFGSNTGEYTILNGEIIESNFPQDQTDEARELAANIQYGKTAEEVESMWADEDALY